jgi:hypothetical protein
MGLYGQPSFPRFVGGAPYLGLAMPSSPHYIEHPSRQVYKLKLAFSRFVTFKSLTRSVYYRRRRSAESSCSLAS